MAEVASAFVSLLPSARGFGSKLDRQIGPELAASGKRGGLSFGKLFAVGAALGLGAKAFDFLGDSLAEATEAAVVGARTSNVIEKMGNAANISAKQVGNLATAISLKTGIDDEAIQSGQNLLLTFGNIRNEVGAGNDIFSQTSKLMVDLSAAMGTDAKGSAIQLGKALNDPIKGISALTRVGVSFTEGQKATIESLVETGDVMGAQKVILGELRRQFGGAAEAMATPADKARTAYANLKEQVGTALLPAVQSVQNAFVRSAPAISSAIAGIGPAFSRVGAFLAPVVAQIRGFFGGGSGGGLLAGIQSFGAAISANFLPVLKTMAATFTGTILPAIVTLSSYLSAKLGPVFTQVGGVIKTQLLPILASLARFFYGTIYPAIVRIASAVAKNLRPVFEQLVATFRGSVLPSLQKMLAKFREWQPTIQRVIKVVVLVIGKVLQFAAVIVGKVLPPVIRLAGFFISKLVPAGFAVIGVIVKIVGRLIAFGAAVVARVKDVAAFVSGLKAKFNEALNFVQTIPGRIRAAFAGAGSWLLSAGRSIVSGLIDGVEDMVGPLIAKFKSITDKIPDWKGPAPKDAIILRPAGRLIMDGLIAGIEDGRKGLRDRLARVTDDIKSSLGKVRSASTDLAKTIADAFRVDLFSATDLGDYFSQGLASVANLQAVKAAAAKLQGRVSEGFLSSLLSSGNSALVLQLAGADPSVAKNAERIHKQQAALAKQIGGGQARDVYGDRLSDIRAELRQANKLLARLGGDVGKQVGREINGAATGGRRRAARA